MVTLESLRSDSESLGAGRVLSAIVGRIITVLRKQSMRGEQDVVELDESIQFHSELFLPYYRYCFEH